MQRLLSTITVGMLLTACVSARHVDVASFDECVQAGYAVQESFPEQCTTAEGKTFVRDIGNAQEMGDLIRVFVPQPGALLPKNLHIEGEARGIWFFEANFGIELYDNNDTLLVSHYATAMSEWMTESFVPFESDITIPDDVATMDGYLLLNRANASGDPSRDMSLRIPVYFR